MAEQKDYLGYPTAPRMVTPDKWFYVTRRGVEIVMHGKNGAEQMTIPWRKVEAALHHHYTAKKTKR